MKAKLLRALALALALLPACGHSRPSEYARLDAAASRAYSAGRYDEAARNWELAARAAKAPRNRSEARYLEASAMLRGGRRDDAIAMFDKILTEDPTGPRAARAAYDRALTLLALGQAERGYAALDAMLRKYPDSGVAPAALRQYSAWLAMGGEERLRRYLETLTPSLEGADIGEFAHYAYAESLERDGNLEAARARYLLVARKYPYPRGALWDDSLFHAAEMDEKLGDPRSAVAHLDEMLSHRETAYMSGSYERPRYDEARYKIAELYRDSLGDANAARRSFETLFAEHKTSRLRDDAAWNAALLAVRAGDRAGACRDLRALVAAIPDSRYVPCAPKLCREMKTTESNRECAEYILRELR